jgi:hypothetical protein
VSCQSFLHVDSGGGGGGAARAPRNGMAPREVPSVGSSVPDMVLSIRGV